MGIMLEKHDIKNKTKEILVKYFNGKIDQEGLFNEFSALADEAIKTWGTEKGKQNLILHLRSQYHKTSGKYKEGIEILLKSLDSRELKYDKGAYEK
jgi:putative IMPACT (imprinted ancient) family translation regulator